MKKHIFLTGPSGCGKTTLIRRALGDKIAYAGGFITERRLTADGSLLGFDLLPALSPDEYEGKLFLDYSVTPPTHDNEVFRNDGVRLLSEAEFYPFSVIDEFGGYEILIPQFREALSEFLSSEQPCIGVLKASKSVQELKSRFGLGDRFTAYTARLLEALSNDPDTLILKVSGSDDKVAQNIVAKWVEEYANV